MSESAFAARVLAAMTDIVMVLGRNGEYLRIPVTGADPQYAPSAELLGRTVRDVLPPKEAEDVCAVIRAAIVADEPIVFEYSLPFAGRIVWFSATVGRLDDDSVVWVARDITAQRGAGEKVRADEEEYRRLEEQFRNAATLETVGLLAGVAHDFNNLLTAIQGHTDLLIEAIDPSDPRRADADAVRKAAERAANLTSQILSFTGKQSPKPEVVELNALVADIHVMLERVMGRDIEVVTRFGASRDGVLVDRGQMQQVLMNVAMNARDAMPDGGTITISTANVELDEQARANRPGLAAGSYVHVSVSDTGRGMSPQVRRRIFEPFYTTQAPTRGAGLGLSTVHGIITQSRGHISVESAIDGGTTFEILLPCVNAVAQGHTRAQSDATAPRGNETVLLVEDEVSVRSLARGILTRKGYTVIDARDGREALALAQRHGDGIHLVLTDAVMPAMGGSELAARLREQRPGLKILFMSGYSEEEIIRREIGNGADTLLAKPFSPDSLATAVRNALDAH